MRDVGMDFSRHFVGGQHTEQNRYLRVENGDAASVPEDRQGGAQRAGYTWNPIKTGKASQDWIRYYRAIVNFLGNWLNRKGAASRAALSQMRPSIERLINGQTWLDRLCLISILACAFRIGWWLAY